MDKDKKQTTLVELLQNNTIEMTIVKGRVFEVGNGDFFRWHDVATQADGFLGFVPVQIPNPKLDAAEQLESLVDIYGDDVIVKSTLNSIAIRRQSEARKLATGDIKMTQFEFDARFDKLDEDIVRRLKTMEHIREHIEAKFQADNADNQNGDVRLF